MDSITYETKHLVLFSIDRFVVKKLKQMKKTIFFISLFMITFFANAQDPNYDGPAKSQVEAFWKNAKPSPSTGKVELYQIKEMDYLFKKIKDKDPAYNTSQMEAELKKADPNWKPQAGGIGNNDAKKNATKVDGLLRYLFVDANLQVGSNTLERVKEQMDLYKNKTNEVLALDLTPVYGSRTSPDDYIKYIAKFNETTDRFVKSKESYMAGETSTEGLETVYYEMQFYQLYWDAAQKIYPAQSSFSATYQRLTALIAKIGSLDKMKGKIQGNKQEQIKNTRLPAVVMQDAALEKTMVEAYNKKYKASYKGTAFKAIILQADWSTERNQLTGRVTGRQKHIAIVYKGDDGKCYLDDTVVLYQEYIGTSFQNTQAINSLGGYEMLCENVK